MGKHQQRLRMLIEQTGGQIDGIFVTKPGCRLVAHTAIDEEAFPLFAAAGIGEPDKKWGWPRHYQMLADLGARLTYLSFRETPDKDNALLRRVAEEMQHLSVFACCHATFLIAGVSVETSMELIAHNEATAARLTTSNTKAMDEPLFRIQGSSLEQIRQKAAITAMLGSRDAGGGMSREFRNICSPGAKATALMYTMNLKDYHKLFIGRIPRAGNEAEVREICSRMCEELHVRFPMVIRSPDEYRRMGNGAKYGS